MQSSYRTLSSRHAIELSEENVKLVLEKVAPEFLNIDLKLKLFMKLQCKDTIGTMFGNTKENLSIGITG